MKLKSIIAPDGDGKHKSVTTTSAPGWARIVANPQSQAAPSVELTVTQDGHVWLTIADANSVGTSHLVALLNDDETTWDRLVADGAVTGG